MIVTVKENNEVKIYSDTFKIIIKINKFKKLKIGRDHPETKSNIISKTNIY